jgi:hypothetical protein
VILPPLVFHGSRLRALNLKWDLRAVCLVSVGASRNWETGLWQGLGGVQLSWGWDGTFGKKNLEEQTFRGGDCWGQESGIIFTTLHFLSNLRMDPKAGCLSLGSLSSLV